MISPNSRSQIVAIVQTIKPAFGAAFAKGLKCRRCDVFLITDSLIGGAEFRSGERNQPVKVSVPKLLCGISLAGLQFLNSKRYRM